MAKAFEQVWKSTTGMPVKQLIRYRLVKAVASPADASAIGIDHAGAGENAIGVTNEPNKQGEPTQVIVHGVSFCECGGAVGPGERVMSDDQGRMVKYVSGADNVVAGTALVGGGAAGDIGSILLK